MIEPGVDAIDALNEQVCLKRMQSAARGVVLLQGHGSRFYLLAALLAKRAVKNDCQPARGKGSFLVEIPARRTPTQQIIECICLRLLERYAIERVPSCAMVRRRKSRCRD